jgi:hypothetical protein
MASAQTTIYDYLTWRSDLSFTASPWNDCDYLLFAILSYVNVRAVEHDAHTRVTSPQDLARSLVALTPPGSKTIDPTYIRSVTAPARRLFEQLAAAPRYAHVVLRNYTDVCNNVDHVQFCAETWMVPNTFELVCFRGTDMSIAGWKEDFLLGLGEVPAQTMAREYLARVVAGEAGSAADDSANDDVCAGSAAGSAGGAADDHPTPLPVAVLGHSKGGNLAAFAAASLPQELQRRIAAVYNLDGPNFSPALTVPNPSAVYGERYRRIVPEFSVVGQLFGTDAAPCVVVKSTAMGLFEHEPLTWCVGATTFIAADGLHPAATRVAQMHAHWERSLVKDAEKRAVDEIFDALYASGKNDITEIVRDPRCWKRVYAAASKVSPVTREYIGAFIECFSVGLADAVGTGVAGLADTVGAKLAGSVGARLTGSVGAKLTDAAGSYKQFVSGANKRVSDGRGRGGVTHEREREPREGRTYIAVPRTNNDDSHR